MDYKNYKNMPDEIELINKISIFPKGYTLRKLNGMYKRLGAIHGLSVKQVKQALDSGKAKIIKQ